MELGAARGVLTRQVNFYARYGFASKGSDVWDIGGVPHTFWCLVAEPEAAAQAA